MIEEGGVEGTIYLLHFDRPLAHARHYVGWAKGKRKGLARRLAEHGSVNGSRLMRAVKAAGITWIVARKWKGTRHLERSLHNRGGKAKLCPICKKEKKK